MEVSKHQQKNVLNNYWGRGLKLDVSTVKAIRDTYCDSPSGSGEDALPLSRPNFELLYETPERSANQRHIQLGSSIGEIREQRVEGLTIVSKLPSHSTPKSYNTVTKPNIDELGISKHKTTRKLDEKKRAKGIEDEFHDIQFQLVKHKKRRKADGASWQIANLKVGDFYFKPEDHSKVKIAANSNFSVIENLRKHLTPRQFKMFKETCFGYFVDLPIVAMQPRLIHTLLLREVVHGNRDELWLSLNGDKIRFGIGEFALVTGLKCTGVAHKRYDDNKSCSLIDRCFGGIDKLNSHAIVDCFEGDAWVWESIHIQEAQQ